MKAIFDTNLFVGAGFNRSSASARLIEAARGKDITMIWNEATRAETRRILTRIPPLSWNAVQGLFLPKNEAAVLDDLSHVAFVADPDDRKFAALSLATRAPIITSDDDLLDHAERLDVLNPSTFWELVKTRS